jgi:FG-GAP-like repeat/FG-GAP repeat
MTPIRSSLLLVLLSVLLLASCIERVTYTPLDDPPPPPTPSAPVLRFPPNNSYRGSVITGSLRPSFQWETSTWSGPEAIRYELQFATDRTFTTGVTTVQTTGTSHQPTANLDASRTAPVGARYFWRVKACVADACSEQSPTWWVNVGRTERDINGDGFADVVTAASGNGASSTTAGRLYVFLGGRGTTFNNVPDTVASNVWYQVAVAAGDLNADGFADLIVRSATNQAGDGSRVVVLFGGASVTLDTVPDGVLVDATSPRSFGTPMVGAGDLDSDGFDDLAVHASVGNSGRVEIYLGGSGAAFDSTSDATFSAPAVNDAFGAALDSAGDVNGDGYADLIVGAHYTSVAGASSGRAYVFFGGQAPLDLVPDGVFGGAAEGDEFGRSVSSAGDVNGDGFSDVVIAAHQNDSSGSNAGRAYVYFGSVGDSMDTTTDGVMSGATADDHAGWTVASAGDINGDGYGDIAVTSIRAAPTSFLRGRVTIYLGAAGGELEAAADTILDGEADGDLFGERVVAADANGDGFDDLMVSAHNNDAIAFAAGRAYVFLGAAGQTLEPNPDGVLNGVGVDDVFGKVAQRVLPKRRCYARRATSLR